MTNTPKLLPSRDKLAQVLHYDPASGHFTWTKKRKQMNPGDRAGSINNNGYWRIHVFGREYAAHRLAWMMFYGVDPVGVLDHVNGDTTDNRIDNLRDVSRAQNSYNSRLAKNNTSGHKNVIWHKRDQKWVVHIGTHGKLRHIGAFLRLEDAVRAADTARKMIHGGFANNGAPA